MGIWGEVWGFLDESFRYSGILRDGVGGENIVKEEERRFLGRLVDVKNEFFVEIV